MLERGFLGQTRQRDELVGVERGTDDGDSLQHLTGCRGDATDHVRVERLHPFGLVGRASVRAR